MSQWKVVLLVVLALGVGIGAGYLAWGISAQKLESEVIDLRNDVDRLSRQLEARDAGAQAGQQRWQGVGVVRAVYPQLLMITHEAIPGLQPARTTGFRLAAGLGADVGDAIQFTVKGTAAHNSVIVELGKL